MMEMKSCKFIYFYLTLNDAAHVSKGCSYEPDFFPGPVYRHDISCFFFGFFLKTFFYAQVFKIKQYKYLQNMRSDSISSPVCRDEAAIWEKVKSASNSFLLVGLNKKHLKLNIYQNWSKILSHVFKVKLMRVENRLSFDI